MFNWETEVICRKNAQIETIESIPDLKIIYPKVFPDNRGFFCESYNVEEWAKKFDFKESLKQVSKSFFIVKPLYKTTSIDSQLLYKIA